MIEVILFPAEERRGTRRFIELEVIYACGAAFTISHGRARRSTEVHVQNSIYIFDVAFTFAADYSDGTDIHSLYSKLYLHLQCSFQSLVYFHLFIYFSAAFCAPLRENIPSTHP